MFIEAPPTGWHRLLCRLLGHAWRRAGVCLVCRRCLHVHRWPRPTTSSTLPPWP